MKLRVLSASDVRRALPMRACVAAMKDAFAQLSAGEATVPLRTSLPVPAHDGATLFMPAYLARSGDSAAWISAGKGAPRERRSAMYCSTRAGSLS